MSYIGPTFRNQTPHTLKRSNSLNIFKHNLKKYYLKDLKNANNSFEISFQFLTISILIFLRILIFEPHDSLLLRDHNVNTSFFKHVLCHPANSKSEFF